MKRAALLAFSNLEPRFGRDYRRLVRLSGSQLDRAPFHNLGIAVRQDNGIDYSKSPRAENIVCATKVPPEGVASVVDSRRRLVGSAGGCKSRREAMPA